MKKLLIAALAGVLLSGCTFRITDFTVISTKNVKVPSSGSAARVTAEDCIVVIIFPFGMPNMKTAIDRAIEKAGPQYDALVDGVVYLENQSFIVGQQCYKVEGTPINTKTAVSLTDEQRSHLLVSSGKGAGTGS